MKRLLCLLMALCCLAPGSSLAQETDMHFNWYEVFVYSYQDSNGDGVGDLPGLLSRLDYISSLGYNGLWLMPVMPSPSYHKYDVTDYRAVDPQYGTLENMRALVDACHARDMRIIIDLPVNHTSTGHPWFTAACKALRQGDESCPYVDYYCFSHENGSKMVPVSGTDWYYEEQFSGGNMPDLNLASPAVQEEIRAIMAFWLQEVGVDGFRLDAVTSYFASDTAQNIAFLSWLKQTAETLKPGSYLVGEVWSGLNAIAEYYQSGVDSFFLFPVSQAEGYIAAALRSRKPAAAYVQAIDKLAQAIPEGVWAPFLSNHDTGRTIGSLQARQAPEKAKFAEGLLGMLGGNAFTYYGEEIGMVGSGDDPNKRLPMYWNDTDMTALPPGVTKVEYAYPCADAQLEDSASLLNYCRAVNLARLQTPAIARGKNETVFSNELTCLLRRTLGEDACYIAINCSSKSAQTITLPEAGLSIVSDLETGADAAALSGTALTLPPYAIVILSAD